MRKTDTYFNTLEYLEGRTDKVMLTKKDVGAVLGWSQPTVRKHLDGYFKDGYIAIPALAEILTKGIKI